MKIRSLKFLLSLNFDELYSEHFAPWPISNIVLCLDVMLCCACNVLLLRNCLNLSPDVPEISQEKLLSLIAERLIDSNSNVNNIADSIDLLPRLTTGIDDSPSDVSDDSYPVSLDESHIVRKGDNEEAAELVRALKLSETALVSQLVDDLSMDNGHLSLYSEENTSHGKSKLDAPAEPVKGNHASYIGNESRAEKYSNDGSTKMLLERTVCSSEKLDQHDPQSKSTSAKPIIIAEEPDLFFQSEHNSTLVVPKENLIETSESYDHIPKCDMVQIESANISEAGDMGTKPDSVDILGSCFAPSSDSKSSNYLDKTQASASNIDSTEPIHEGEDCILDSKSESCQNQEHVYEGKVILADQVENMDALSESKSTTEMTVKEGVVARNFLRNSASQLSVYGLFRLQDGIKERGLCVFFRNNHFNTMFKFRGGLYILVTDQGYINQPDLVWEKLNEVTFSWDIFSYSIAHNY
ncbi:hypothetical protein LIER_35558 [Lithospermum erythrorhizon]|uniref:MINDY deubiquitinase domain-containing protein n=1 Tax=Lithospermum erythrorhizon TaxID=34254 RepID=A0AAV3NV70_LITER